MVWRKVILSFLLICCILLVAASGSPANAADMESVDSYVSVIGSVSDYALEYFRDYLFSYPLDPSKDYLLVQLENPNTFVLFVGFGSKNGTDYFFSSEVIYMLISEDGENYSLFYDIFPLDFVIQNPDCFVVYSSFDSDASIYERRDVFAFASLVLFATGIVCYLLRSIYSFCLRRKD